MYADRANEGPRASKGATVVVSPYLRGNAMLLLPWGVLLVSAAAGEMLLRSRQVAEKRR